MLACTAYRGKAAPAFRVATWRCLAGLALVALAACAAPQTVHRDDRSYLERAERQVSAQFVVRAAALSAAESEQLFGVPLNAAGIQPVWISVANRTDDPHWMFPISVDADYFPPYEVARRAAGLVADLSRDALYRRLAARRIDLFVQPHATAEGFVYTHADEGMKAFTVELHGGRARFDFHFVAPVPGVPGDYFDVDTAAIYPHGAVVDLDAEGLRDWLATLGCCPANAEAVAGDPANLVFVGSLDRVRGALITRGWDVTAPVTGDSLGRMVSAFLFGSRYRYAPVSPLYLFEREHDMAFQKARAAIEERNHMRLWLAPVTVGGAPVWVGQVSRDVGIKLSGRFWPPTTHVIDPDVDDARFYVMQDLFALGAVRELGFVRGQPPAPAGAPHRNAEGDPYFTDGLRAVFFLSDDPVPVAAIRLRDWLLPENMAPYREAYVAPAEAAPAESAPGPESGPQGR